jgi:hypothetical protein
MLNTVRLKMTAGTYEHEFVGTGFWSPAALKAVLGIRDWVKTNRQQLLAKNPQPPSAKPRRSTPHGLASTTPRA